MPLTAMNDMPDQLQGLKRENLLGYEHVLGDHVWEGEGDAMMGLAETAWTPPGQQAASGIPLASGLSIQTPDFSSAAFNNPASWANYAGYLATTLAQNKMAKSAIQAQAHADAGHPDRGSKAASGSGQLMTYAPYILGGVLILSVAVYASKSRGS